MFKFGKGSFIYKNPVWNLSFELKKRTLEINTVFFKACEQGDIQTLKNVLSKIRDINVKTKEGWTGLVLAVYSEHFEIAKFLVANGANVNSTNHKGTTVFMYAKTPVFKSKNTTILNWLLENGADINAMDLKASMTVLDYAILNNALWLEN